VQIYEKDLNIMHWLLQYLTLYNGLREVLRHEPQLDGIPRSMGLLRVALERSMA